MSLQKIKKSYKNKNKKKIALNSAGGMGKKNKSPETQAKNSGCTKQGDVSEGLEVGFVCPVHGSSPVLFVVDSG